MAEIRREGARNAVYPIKCSCFLGYLSLEVSTATSLHKEWVCDGTKSLISRLQPLSFILSLIYMTFYQYQPSSAG